MNGNPQNYNMTNAAGYGGVAGSAFAPVVTIKDIKELIIRDYYIGNEMPLIATAKGMWKDFSSYAVMYTIASRSGNRVPATQTNENGETITQVNTTNDVMPLCHNIKRKLKVAYKDSRLLDANGNSEVYLRAYNEQEQQRDIENICTYSYHAILSGIDRENTGYRDGKTRHGLFIGSQAKPYDLDAAAKAVAANANDFDALSEFFLRIVTVASEYGLAKVNNAMLPNMAAPVSSLTFVVPQRMFPYVMKMYARLTRFAARPEDYTMINGNFFTFIGYNVLVSNYMGTIRNPNGSGDIAPVMLLDTNMVAHTYLPLQVNEERVVDYGDKVWETQIIWGTKLLRKNAGILGQVLINDMLGSQS